MWYYMLFAGQDIHMMCGITWRVQGGIFYRCMCDVWHNVAGDGGAGDVECECGRMCDIAFMCVTGRHLGAH